jgi:hypothetical protein
MTAKLDIKRELSSVDLRDYDFYNNLSEDEKKSFSPYILMRYVSNVQSNSDIQEWFVETTNELVNKNHWTLSKNHKELLWKLFAATGLGQTLFHPYLAAGKKEKVNKIEKLLAELHPSWKLEDIKFQASLMTKQDCTDLFDKLGFDKKQRKEYE